MKKPTKGFIPKAPPVGKTVFSTQRVGFLFSFLLYTHCIILQIAYGWKLYKQSVNVNLMNKPDSAPPIPEIRQDYLLLQETIGSVAVCQSQNVDNRPPHVPRQGASRE